MMQIIELLLPIYDNKGQPFSDAQMLAIREEMVTRFGGLTTARTPRKASGRIAASG